MNGSSISFVEMQAMQWPSNQIPSWEQIAGRPIKSINLTYVKDASVAGGVQLGADIVYEEVQAIAPPTPEE